MEADRAIDLLLALLNASIALLIVTQGRRRARRLGVPLIVLAGFFALRGVSRLVSSLGHGDTKLAQVGLGQLLDVLLVVALVGILVTIERVLRGVAAVEDAARYREEEYERAKRHYTQVVRHRVMNPLAAIRGAALTLRDVRDIDEAARDQLLEAVIDGCNQIEAVSLAPERRDALEKDLDAVPNVGSNRRLTRYPDGPPGPS